MIAAISAMFATEWPSIAVTTSPTRIPAASPARPGTTRVIRQPPSAGSPKTPSRGPFGSGITPDAIAAIASALTIACVKIEASSDLRQV